MNEKLDAVLNVLYDEQLLHWKSVLSTDILIFGKQKFRLNLTEPEVNFVIAKLTDEGYVSGIADANMLIHYSLTTKGIQLKLSGGFTKQTRTERRKQKLVDWSLIAVIVAGIYYLLEIFKTIAKICQ